jgi:photosystem II stability/assembly factor-like uncharacterized protein/Tol biopolymer transport system component
MRLGNADKETLMRVARSLVVVAALVMVLAGGAPAFEPSRPAVLVYCHNLETRTGWLLDPHPDRLVPCLPRLNAAGTRLYTISHGPKAVRAWEVQVADLSGSRPGEPSLVTQTERLELAVVPSPDEQKLALVVADGDAVDLVVADLQGTVLATIAHGVDAYRTELAWSHDGTHIYFTVPAGARKGLALKRATADGAAVETLAAFGVGGFDVCGSRDRAVAVAGSRLHVFDEGEARAEHDLGFRAESARVSPDGTRAALGGARLVVVSLESGKIVAATTPPEGPRVLERHPAWSPRGGPRSRGDRVAFVREFHLDGPHLPLLNSRIVFWSLADGAEELQYERVAHFDRLQWSSNGKWLVFDETAFDETGGVKPLVFAELPVLRPAPAGAHWKRLAGPSTNGVRTLAISPADTTRLYAVSRGLYVSDDRGATWRPCPVLAEGASAPRQLIALAVSASDAQRLYAASADGVWRTDDGGETWSLCNPDVQDYQFVSIAVAPDDAGHVYVLNGPGALLRTDGRSTSTVHEFDEALYNCTLTIDPRRPSTFCIARKPTGVIGVAYGVIRVSLDRGKTWRELTPPDGAACITSLVARGKDSDELVYRTDTGRCYSSGDGGVTWTLCADPADPALWTDDIQRDIEALAIVPPGANAEPSSGSPYYCRADPTEPSRLYGNLPGRGLHRSDDGGKTWTSANGGLGPLAANAMLALPDVPGGLLVGGDGWLARTTDGGASWCYLADPFNRATLWNIVACPTDPCLIFVMSEYGGMYRSEDSGATWAAVPDAALGRGVRHGACLEFSDDAAQITAYSAARIYRSADGGRSWRPHASFYPPYEGYRGFQQVADGHAITVGKVNWHRLFQSRDEGRTWRVVEGPFRAYGIMAMLGRPDDPEALYLLAETDYAGTGPTVLFVSRDLGHTWAVRPLPDTPGMASTLARNPAAPDVLAVGTTSGAVWLSFDDGLTWRDSGAGLPRERVELLAFGPGDEPGARDRLYAHLKDDALYAVELPETD